MFLVMIGTKAQLIKMAPIMKEMELQSVPYRFVLTGQHKETITDIINAFEIKSPDFELVNISESDTSIKLLKWLVKSLYRGVFPKKGMNPWRGKITATLVHGDTLSTLVAAFLSRLKGIPVCHIEAGLRSFDYFHPFPEEIIRVLVSKLSTYYYCPDDWSFNNLKSISPKKIRINTKCNTLLDSVKMAVMSGISVDIPDEPFSIASVHRYENLSDNDRFGFIMKQIELAAESIKIIFVLHPATRAKLKNTVWWDRLEKNQNIILFPRTDYIRFIKLLSKANFLISDGGSNQEECSFLNIPCLLMRKKTERIDGLGGNVILSNYSVDTINKFVEKNIGSIKERSVDSLIELPSNMIVQHLSNIFS